MNSANLSGSWDSYLSHFISAKKGPEVVQDQTDEITCSRSRRTKPDLNLGLFSPIDDTCPSNILAGHTLSPPHTLEAAFVVLYAFHTAPARASRKRWQGTRRTTWPLWFLSSEGRVGPFTSFL